MSKISITSDMSVSFVVSFPQRKRWKASLALKNQMI